MPDLTVQFACNDAETWAEEFQRHLVDRKIIPAAVKKDAHDSEIWLNYPNTQSDTIKRIIREAHPWCLDRSLSLLQNTGEGGESQEVVVMIADLTKVME